MSGDKNFISLNVAYIAAFLLSAKKVESDFGMFVQIYLTS